MQTPGAQGVERKSSCNSMGEFTFRFATEEDDPALRTFLKQIPMPGRVSVTFEREPWFFGGNQIEGDDSRTLLAEDSQTGEIAGMGTWCSLEAWVNGEKERLGYLGQLRTAKAHRGHLSFLKKGYELLGASLRPSRPLTNITTIIEDNWSARNFLARPKKGFPLYQERGRLFTFVISTRQVGGKKFSEEFELRNAISTDLPEMADFLCRVYRVYQFSPVWSEIVLRNPSRTRGLSLQDFTLAIERTTGRLVGCLALWDQRAFKQTVVHSYSGSLRWARRVLNPIAGWARIPELPPPGTVLSHAFLSHLAVEKEAQRVLPALVSCQCDVARKRGIDSLMIGVGEGHPLLGTLGKMSVLEYRSVVYIVKWPEENGPAIDPGPIHLEIAIL